MWESSSDTTLFSSFDLFKASDASLIVTLFRSIIWSIAFIRPFISTISVLTLLVKCSHFDANYCLHCVKSLHMSSQAFFTSSKLLSSCIFLLFICSLGSDILVFLFWTFNSIKESFNGKVLSWSPSISLEGFSIYDYFMGIIHIYFQFSIFFSLNHQLQSIFIF